MLAGPASAELCRSLRQRSNVLVIMLTARDTEVDRAVGLGLGADDYVTRPSHGASSSRGITALAQGLPPSSGLVGQRAERSHLDGVASVAQQWEAELLLRSEEHTSELQSLRHLV